MQQPEELTTERPASTSFVERAKHRTTYPLLILAIILAYGFQLSWFVAASKGPFEEDYAWEELAQKTLDYQYSGTPQMKIEAGRISHELCGLWNFEVIWGSCATVKLHLLVRDLQPEHHHIVQREVAHLAEQLQTPCRLLLQLGLENNTKLRNSIGCGGWRKQFSLSIPVHKVTIEREKTSPVKPNRWPLSSSIYLYTYGPVAGRR